MAPRRIDPRLLAAFEREGVAPPDFETPGRVVEVPLPEERFQTPASSTPAPKSRLDMVREYLERTRSAAPAPDFGPPVDINAAREADAVRDFRGGMLAAGQSFLGNRSAVGQVRQSNTNEAAALSSEAARKKALADWASQQDKRRMDEAGVLSRAAVEPREASKSARTTEQIDRELDIKEQDAETRRLTATKVKPVKVPKDPDSSKLRKEFDSLPEVKAFKDVSIGMDKIRTAAKSATAPGDMALIFAFMKILDPGSSVKEGEYASAKDAQGVPDKVLTAYNKAVDGEILAPDTRAAFVRESEGLYEAERARYSEAAQRYRGLAEKQKMAPDDVAMDRPAAGIQPAPTGDAQHKGKVPMLTAKGLTIWVTPETAAAGEKAKTLRKP